MNAPALALETIQVDVAFYDDAEKKKLLVYPTASVMQALVSQPLEIPKSEFLTYYLFHHIKLGKPGYRDFQSVAQKIHLWLSAIAECIDYDDGSVRTNQRGQESLIGECCVVRLLRPCHEDHEPMQQAGCIKP